MSADDGFYILETEGPEYRVKHLQAVENYMWDDKKIDEQDGKPGAYTNDPDVHIRNARKMWKKCKVFTNKKEAVKYAFNMEEEAIKDMEEYFGFGFTEYGVCHIKIPRKF